MAPDALFVKVEWVAGILIPNVCYFKELMLSHFSIRLKLQVYFLPPARRHARSYVSNVREDGRNEQLHLSESDSSPYVTHCAL